MAIRNDSGTSARVGVLKWLGFTLLEGGDFLEAVADTVADVGTFLFTAVFTSRLLHGVAMAVARVTL